MKLKRLGNFLQYRFDFVGQTETNIENNEYLMIAFSKCTILKSTPHVNRLKFLPIYFNDLIWCILTLNI